MLCKFYIWRCLYILNIRDRIKAIDDEYSESEIYLEYGLPSLMLYEPTPYKNLIVDINIERDKYTATEGHADEKLDCVMPDML